MTEYYYIYTIQQAINVAQQVLEYTFNDDEIYDLRENHEVIIYDDDGYEELAYVWYDSDNHTITISM